MSSIVRFHRSPIGAAVAAVRAMVDIIVRAHVALQNRREVSALLGADPGMLRDLGLTPMDINCALAEPMWRDPSARLMIWSIERRAAARAAVRENLEGLGQPEVERGLSHENFY